MPGLLGALPCLTAQMRAAGPRLELDAAVAVAAVGVVPTWDVLVAAHRIAAAQFQTQRLAVARAAEARRLETMA